MSSKGMLKIISNYIIYCSVQYIWVLYAELLYTQGLSVLRVIDTGPYFFQLKMVCKVMSLLISWFTITYLCTGNHTVAVIKGQESYELLQTSCSSIFRDINSLVDSKKVTIDGKDIPVEVYLGDDYKVNNYSAPRWNHCLHVGPEADTFLLLGTQAVNSSLIEYCDVYLSPLLFKCCSFSFLFLEWSLPHLTVLAFGVKSTRQIGTVKFLQTISHCVYIPAIAFIRDVPDPGTRIRYPVKYRHPAVSVCRFCVLRNCDI
jgi:hypothetical protein